MQDLSITLRGNVKPNAGAADRQTKAEPVVTKARLRELQRILAASVRRRRAALAAQRHALAARLKASELEARP